MIQLIRDCTFREACDDEYGYEIVDETPELWAMVQMMTQARVEASHLVGTRHHERGAGVTT